MKIECSGFEQDIYEEDEKTITHLMPEAIFVNGNQNIIIRLVDENGNIRRIYEYKRATANVTVFEKP